MRLTLGRYIGVYQRLYRNETRIQHMDYTDGIGWFQSAISTGCNRVRVLKNRTGMITLYVAIGSISAKVILVIN